MQSADIAVVGAGPAGLTAALCLAHAGRRILLIAPPEPDRKPDRRTTALLGGSVHLLENLGVWTSLAARAAPLEGIRLVDDRNSLFPAPELTFRAAEIGAASFGANVENQDLVAALLAAVASAPAVTRREASVAAVEAGPTGLRLLLDTGETVDARLAIAADGRNSLIRKAAGIDVRTWSYPQAALAVSFSHSREHGHVSTELHRRNGPFTVVPLAGRRSSLVWVESPSRAQALAALPASALARVIEDELQGLLGAVTDLGHRGVFPLSGLTAASMGARRTALVGEAAHVMPPIGAQGLNLGFRDAAAIAELVAEAASDGSDPGSDVLLARYHRARMSDVLVRQASIDALNRSLLSDLLPVQALRGAGFHLLARVAPLRDFVMRAGLGPTALPPLMRQHVA
ncbi:MAG: UbiH/UbiF family hydroxylase [Hyphomicrobiaceae bacterium]|nr:UbiH/UbiF family hydroxylase [Hyphomicrobiaceae bacterium]